MKINPKIKPLYANLKRLNFGEYLQSSEFEHFSIENNFDQEWGYFKQEINFKKYTSEPGKDEEEAFFILMNHWDNQYFELFIELTLKTLLNYADWLQYKIDINPIYENLKTIGVYKKELLNFITDFRAIINGKPIKTQQNVSQMVNKQNLSSRNIFVVHGHDELARLKLCNILKEELNLVPIVLQEEANITVETIISKLDRLADQCSAAIILSTPDDNSDGKFRARQNVILELGYFLGKFHAQGTRRIILIKTGDIEFPSDISRVLYLEYKTDIKEIFLDMKKQFEIWGY